MVVHLVLFLGFMAWITFTQILMVTSNKSYLHDHPLLSKSTLFGRSQAVATVWSRQCDNDPSKQNIQQPNRPRDLVQKPWRDPPSIQQTLLAIRSSPFGAEFCEFSGAQQRQPPSEALMAPSHACLVPRNLRWSLHRCCGLLGIVTIVVEWNSVKRLETTQRGKFFRWLTRWLWSCASEYFRQERSWNLVTLNCVYGQWGAPAVCRPICGTADCPQMYSCTELSSWTTISSMSYCHLDWYWSHRNSQNQSIPSNSYIRAVIYAASLSKEGGCNAKCWNDILRLAAMAQTNYLQRKNRPFHRAVKRCIIAEKKQVDTSIEWTALVFLKILAASWGCPTNTPTVLMTSQAIGFPTLMPCLKQVTIGKSQQYLG